MNDWTQIDETHWQTTEATLMGSPHKLVVINAAGNSTGFVAVLPDKPNICIFFKQMQPVWDREYQIIAYEFVYRGVTYRINKEEVKQDG